MLANRENSKRSRSNYPPDHQQISRRNEDFMSPGSFFDAFSPSILMNGDPFSHMNHMMERMEKFSRNIFGNFHDPGIFDSPMIRGGNSQFYSQTIMQSTKLDRNGRPVVEKYRSEAKGMVDPHEGMIGERKQAYAHSGTGLEKYGHERMIGNKGRKVVKEKVGDYERQSDLYKNMGMDDAQDFDRRWGQVAGGNALPGPNGNIYGRMGDRYVQEERKVDDRKRGDYIPNNWRAENQPVRRTDIQPTVPSIRNQNRNNALALPAPPVANPQPQRRNNARPNQTRKTPAAAA